jgi:hypothetical protein
MLVILMYKSLFVFRPLHREWGLEGALIVIADSIEDVKELLNHTSFQNSKLYENRFQAPAPRKVEKGEAWILESRHPLLENTLQSRILVAYFTSI